MVVARDRVVNAGLRRANAAIGVIANEVISARSLRRRGRKPVGICLHGVCWALWCHQVYGTVIRGLREMVWACTVPRSHWVAALPSVARDAR